MVRQEFRCFPVLLGTVGEGWTACKPKHPKIGLVLDEPIRETGPHLAELLDLEGDGPLYRRISDALRRAVDRGEIPLGTILPPERTLAAALSVSRATVVTAYERLKTDGWLESRQGSGTWVRRPEAGRRTSDAASTSRLFIADRAETPTPTPVRAEDDVVDLSVAAVMGTPTVVDVLSSLGPADAAALTTQHGYAPAGLRELRQFVARRLSDQAVPTSEDQVVITTGAQQAIWVLARRHVQAGETVLVESPTFPGALDAFRAIGARMVPLPVDEHGARSDLLADLVERLQPRLLYLTPHFHSPTGAVMPPDRREEIADLAARERIHVIEDLTLADVNLDEGATPPPIAAAAPQAPIHTVGSTAKLFWAGLRVGWVREPESEALGTLASKTVSDFGTSMMSQLLALRLLERLDEVVLERRAELLPRRDLLCSLLSEHLPEWRWRVPTGGLSLWVELPEGNADEFAEIAQRHGVAVVPGTALSVDSGNRRGLRVVYARPEDAIAEGVRRLTAAWRAYGPAQERPVSRLLV
jgi:DNA-binding transcriptional MocR family regulator